MTQLVPVTYRDIPLIGAAKHWSAPLGSSVLDIVREVPELPCYFSEVGFVCVNGEEVPREWWGYVRPKAHSVVTLHVRLEHGGSQKILASVAALAVILIAAIAAPLIAGALFPSGSALFLGTQAAVGIIGSVGGALLYSALAPPPATAPASAGPTQDISVKAAALSGNTLKAGDNLARVLGYRRVFPSFISQPVVELVGLKEVVEGVYGLAGPHLIDHIYTADVDVSTMQEVSTQITQGFPNSIPQTLVPRQGFVVAPNTDLSQPIFDTSNTNRLLDPANPTADLSFYHRFTSRVAPDEFWLSLAFTEGLINTSSNQLGCPVRVRFRIRGTTAWTDCPEIHFRTSSTSALQVTIKLMWQAPSTAALVTPDSQTGGWIAYFSTPNQTAGSFTGVGAFTANSYFYGGSGDTFYDNANVATTGLQNIGMYTDRVEFYLDPTVFPQAPYEVEVRRGQAYQSSNWTRATYQYNPGTGNAVYDLFGYAVTAGAPSWIEPQGSLRNKAAIIRHTSIWNEPPVAAGAPIATIAVKAVGRSIQQLSCDAGGYVDQTLTGAPGVFDTSQNPADHYRDVLVGSLGAFPLQASQIDNLVTWYNDCNSNGYNINAVVQGMKQMDVLKLIAAAGYAKPIQSETWGVAEDKDRTGLAPTQIFTPRNLSSFQWTKAFHPYIDGLRVKFDDALNLFVETELIVLDPDLQTGGIRLEDMRYDTIVQSGDATRRALFDLKQARSRLEFYSGVADIENLVCRVGDLVGVNHDVLSSEVGYARVISTTTATGNLTGLVLDDSFPGGLLDFFSQPLTFFNDPTLNFFNKPERVGAMIRCSDGTFLVKEVVATVVAFGNALQFNGSTTDMDFPFGSPFSSASPGLTFSCRFKTSTAGTSSGTILGTTNSGLTNPATATNFNNVFYVNTANKLQGGWNDGAVKTVTSAASVNDGNWHNGLITILNGSVVQLWLDNISQGTVALGTGATTTTDLWVGHNNVTGWPNMNAAASNWFNGIVDDVRVWNRVLAPADISTVFHGGEVFNGLVFRCTMEDTSGKDGIGGHNATIVNGPPTVVAGDPALGTTDPTSVTFATPFVDPGTVVKNCLVGFGPLGSETLRLLVQQIAPKKDFTADITFVDEAPELFASKPTSLLLHFDGTNGQTTTVDSSSSPTTVVMTVATLTTGNFKFGTASCTFNGSTALVTAAEQGNDFFSGGDFTIDWWFRTASATNGCMCHKGAALAFGPWRVDATAAGNIAFSSSSNGSSYDIANAVVICPNPLDNVFHHFAVTRQGSYFFFFLDGNIQFSFFSASVPFYVKDQIIIGSNGAGGVFFNGQIDEFRYTNGLARWISSFNPPIAAGNP